MESVRRPPPELEVLQSHLERAFHLCLVCLSHSWGGLEQVAANDAIDMGAAGFPTTVLCMEGTPIQEFLANRPNVNLVALDFQPRNYFDLKMKFEIQRLLLSGINLIHTHQTSLLGTLIPWLWNSPQISLIASRHIMNNHGKKDFVHRTLFRRLDALLVMSEMLRKNVISTHAIQERKVKVVRLGLDFDRFDPEKVRPEALRTAWGVDAETVVVGLVGRIDPAKGQGAFIKAAAGILKDQTRRKLKFILIGDETRGSESDYLSELRAMVQQFRLEDQLLFTGFQENIPEVMSALDILVMPSRQEAFGLVAIEAMAMQRPVIISRGGSAEEIVGTDGALISGQSHCGLIIRPDDAFDLQQKIRYLLDQPQARLEMGKRARAKVLQLYDRKLRLRRTLEVYEKVLRRRRSI